MTEELLFKDYFDHFNSLITQEELASKEAYKQTIGKKVFELINMGRCLHKLRVVKRTHAHVKKDFDSRDSIETRWHITLENIDKSSFRDNSFVPGSNVFILNDPLEDTAFKESYSKISALIIHINKQQITLELPETKEGIYHFRDDLTLVLGADRVTYPRQREMLKYFCSESYQGDKDIRDKITSLFRNKFTFENVQINKKIDSFFFKLDKSKTEAVQKILGPNKISLLHGPPGTGKTQACAEVICQTIKNDLNKKILVCCDSNQAVDNILLKVENLLSSPANNIILRIGQPFKVQKNALDYTLETKFNEHPLYKFFLPLLYEESQSLNKDIKKLYQEYHRAIREKGSMSTDTYDTHEMYKQAQKNNYLIQEQIKRTKAIIHKEITNNARIFFCTNSLSGSPEIRSLKFDLIVIDEATQSTEPSILIPLSLGNKILLAGDHKQLPPTVLSVDKNRQSELSISLFEKIILKDKNLASTLKIQYRMNDDLLEFPNKEFYGELESANENKNKHLDLIFDKSVVFINSNTKENTTKTETLSEEGFKSKFNEGDVNIISKIVKTYRSLTLTEKNMMVLTPYSLQKQRLNNNLKEYGLRSKTVDEAQGQQNDIIMLSLVRNNDKDSIGFLEDVRRFNVAITRAKVKLIVVGNKKTLCTNKMYASWIAHIQKNGLYIDESELNSYLDINDEKIDELKELVKEYRIVRPSESYNLETSNELININKPWFESLDYASLSENLKTLFVNAKWSMKKEQVERLKNIFEILNEDNAKNILLTFYWISLRKFYSDIKQNTPRFILLANRDRDRIEDFCIKKGYLSEEDVIDLKNKMSFVEDNINQEKQHTIFEEDNKEVISETKIVTDLFS